MTTENIGALVFWRRNLKRALKMRGIHLGPASESIGKNPQWLGRVLKGQHDPSMDSVFQLCVKNQIPIAELFSGVSADIIGDFEGLSTLEQAVDDETAGIVLRLISSEKND